MVSQWGITAKTCWPNTPRKLIHSEVVNVTITCGWTGVGNIAFLLAAASAGAYQPQPLVAASTVKSLDAFGACFAQAQEDVGRAWAFVPTDGGGSFTNEGASDVSTAYRLQISRSGSCSQVRLYAASGGSSASLVKAIDQCR